MQKTNSTKLEPGIGYTSQNVVELIQGGAPYFRLLEELIDRARNTIHLQVYIYNQDETGTRITNALIRAAQRGVTVFMLLDGYASRSLNPEVIVSLDRCGIRFRWFEPVLRGKNFYLGRRMHHKIFVADGLYSLIGGINISNHYNDLPDHPAWMDWAVYVKGQTSVELYNRCMQMWYRGSRKVTLLSSVITPFETEHDCYVRVRINDWVRNKNQISRSYAEMFHRAHSRITIMSSYFLPGRILRKNLRLAAARGVKVRIILTSISDITMAKMAERFFYPWLLRRQIEIYEYRKKVVHGKISTYDGQWVTIGSYNFNNISAYASIELNLDIHNTRFAREVDRALEEIIELDCDRITPEIYAQKTTGWQKFIHRVSYEMVRFIFFLFTFYFRQEKKK